jgi:hypothetical protein
MTEVLTLQTCETHISDDGIDTLVTEVRNLLKQVESLRQEQMTRDVVYDSEGVLKPEVVRAIRAALRRKKSISDKELCKRLGLCHTK